MINKYSVATCCAYLQSPSILNNFLQALAKTLFKSMRNVFWLRTQNTDFERTRNNDFWVLLSWCPLLKRIEFIDKDCVHGVKLELIIFGVKVSSFCNAFMLQIHEFVVKLIYYQGAGVYLLVRGFNPPPQSPEKNVEETPLHLVLNTHGLVVFCLFWSN